MNASATMTPTADHEMLAERIRRIRQHGIDFIGNDAFTDVEVARSIRAEDVPELTAAQPLPQKDLPAHLARLCESTLLTADRERNLFRRMNFLKHEAAAALNALSPDTASHADVDAIECLLEESRQVRDVILQANVRLVISIVKKFVAPQHAFDELLSEGIMTLMAAVDKFDYDRGFRFSTYAYRSIARNAYRAVTDQVKENSRFVSASAELDFEDHGGATTTDVAAWETLRDLLSNMMDRLDRREQFILRGRYALGAHRKVRTFQSLADKLGVSKERVRQLEQRAVAKLRSMAAESGMAELADVAMG